MNKPTSKQSTKDARALLKKHLQKQYQSNGGNIGIKWKNPFRTEYTMSSPGTEEEFSKPIIREDNYYTSKERNMVKSSSVPYHKNQIRHYQSSQQNNQTLFKKSKKYDISQNESYENGQGEYYVKEVKEIVGNLLQKLLKSKFKPKSTLSKSTSMKIRSRPNQLDSSNLSTQKDLIRNQQGQLLEAKNRTISLVQELQGIKDLWKKAHFLRMELGKQEVSAISQNSKKYYKNSTQSPSSKQNTISQFQDLIIAMNKMQSNKTQKQLKEFQRNICQHIVQLRDRVMKIQQVTNPTNSPILTNEQFQQINELIDQLQKRNHELQQDNIRILQQNQQIHNKINQLQQVYKYKTKQFQQKIRQLKYKNQLPRVIEEESQQYEIHNLKQEINNLEMINQQTLIEMKQMQETIHYLEGERDELSSLVQSYEIREHESSISHTKIVLDLKSKLSSLQEQNSKFEEYKRTQVTTLNHSLTKIQESVSQKSITEVKQIVPYKPQFQNKDNEQTYIKENKKVRIVLKQKLQNDDQTVVVQQTQQPTSNKMPIKKKQSKKKDILQLFEQLLDQHSAFNVEDKEQIVAFIQRTLDFKEKYDENSIDKMEKQSNLSCGTFEDRSVDGDINPTYIDVFSKFDMRQQSIFRLIDYIGSNLRSGDLLTQLVNEFVMKVMPKKDYEQYETIAEQFILKVRDYQQKKIVTVDKALSNFIVMTQGVFKEKDQIEAALDQSSSDQDQNDKFLWEDILNTAQKQQQKTKQVRRTRMPGERTKTANTGYLYSSVLNEQLPTIPEQKSRKRPSVVVSEEDSYSHTSTPNHVSFCTPIKKILDDQ